MFEVGKGEELYRDRGIGEGGGGGGTCLISKDDGIILP